MPKASSSVGRRTWSRYSYESEKETLVPPRISRSMGIGVVDDDSPSPLAKRRTGKMAWKMSMVLEAAELAVILNCRDLRVDGLSLGRNSTVWLPTERPETWASVALASHSIAATCCALRPGDLVSVAVL